ncbi:oligopeptide/dipeptide ABC transporter ATP-binding protein [Bacillus toyonensis]
MEHLCTKIGIMYLGTIVETAPRDELFTNPLHPYTKALLSAVPIPDPTVKRERIILEGIFPVQQIHLQVVVFIHSRPFATDVCTQTVPEFRNVGEDHFVACHHV